MDTIGLPEILFILLICLLIFGAGKLPEIGKSLGQTIKEFKKAMKEVGNDADGKKENPPK